jgi:hypothetical protein
LCLLFHPKLALWVVGFIKIEQEWFNTMLDSLGKKKQKKNLASSMPGAYKDT